MRTVMMIYLSQFIKILIKKQLKVGVENKAVQRKIRLNK
jgi:hypothetical protein